MLKKKICVFTGSRAEYGLLKPLIDEIKSDNELELQLIVSGTHLSMEFGLTYNEIEKDNFKIDEKVEILLSSDTPTAILKSMGLALISFGESLNRLKPDIIAILGDRFEAFCMAASAMISNIPIIHLYGGESTYGLIDEAIRHSITKMSHLHFTSTEEYRRRVIQLGEDPERVFNVGALGLDNIKKLKLLSKGELEKKLSFKFNKHNLLVTFHPVTLEYKTSGTQFKKLLNVIDKLKNTNIIFTKSNADTYGRIINQMIDEYVLKNNNSSRAFTSMGIVLYLSTMKYVDGIVGNSSSAIIESPSFKIGAINIGDRQKGRIKAKNVIDCEPTERGIRDAVAKLYSYEFQKSLKSIINPYGDGRSAKRIKDIIKKYDLSNILKKKFYEIN